MAHSGDRLHRGEGRNPDLDRVARGPLGEYRQEVLDQHALVSGGQGVRATAPQALLHQSGVCGTKSAGHPDILPAQSD